MAAKGYTTLALVTQALNQTLSAAQQAEATALIETAEIWIDGRGQAWGVATITAETHIVSGGMVTLNNRPMTAITTVTVKPYPYIAATATTLVSGTTYELLSAVTGLLFVGDGLDGWLLTVTYTAPTTIPANVRDAATALVAHWLRQTLDGVGSDVASYSVAGDLSVTFKEASKTTSIPPRVYDLLGRRLVFA